MTTCSAPYRGFRYPAEVIQHAVWLYHCFSASLRDVELILAARGVVVSYETIRAWGLRFGRVFANTLKRRLEAPLLLPWTRCGSCGSTLIAVQALALHSCIGMRIQTAPFI